ncbi:MAG: hypothetical protein ACO32I_06855 [Candidatus Limnocylindrus sp.]
MNFGIEAVSGVRHEGRHHQPAPALAGPSATYAPPPAAPALAGPIEDAVSDAMANTLFGKKGSGTEAQRQEFFSGVLSKTASKFVSSPEGKQVVNKVTLYAAIPAFAAGMLVMYLLYKSGKVK